MQASARLTCTAFLAVIALGANLARAEDDAFHRIRRLEGTWHAVDAQGRPTEQVTSIFRVTANGHAVQEIMFPGTANEMVNMYYRDVEQVRMTHYCAGGNQPTMQLLAGDRPDVVRLVFEDITNMVTADDEHMHEGQYQWLDEDHLKTEWRSFRNGRYLDTMRFEMVRLR